MSHRILIVGAGPTGMIMAGQLARLDVPVRLIDRLDDPVTTSRAFTIHARTLELLGTMGLAETFLSKSLKTLSMDYHFPQKAADDVPKLDFSELDSTFPFCLTIDQADTEAILREHIQGLGVEVEWGTRLTDFAETPSGVEVTLEAGGRSETAEVDWLVGCDGFYSTVRKQLELPFDGSDYEGTMRMMDVPVEGLDVAEDAIHYYIAKDHMLLVNKLPGENFRVLISDKNDVAEQVSADAARAEMQGVVNKHFGDKVTLGQPVWNTAFRLARRQVNSYRRGRVFLAGDAAHVNSPAGGQGMNVAMQDAFNLGWKLGMVVRGEGKETLLESYEAERAPVAQQMLEGTNYIHSIIMAHGKGMQERLERMQADDWNKRAVSQIAGISYTYAERGAELTDLEGVRLQVGDRAPDAHLGEKRIYDLVAPTGYTLFYLLNSDAAAQQAQATSAHLAERFKTSFTPWFITPPALSLETQNGAHVTDPEPFRQRYESLDADHVYVIRPDCHIDYKGPAQDAAALEAHLERVLV